MTEPAPLFDPAVLQRLRPLLADGGRLIEDGFEAEPYLVDWRRRFAGRAAAIVAPCSVAEVQAILRMCARHGLKVQTQGGNTGMCGGASPQQERTVLLSTRRLAGIRQLSPEGRYVIAGAGTTVEEVNTAARPHGLFLPIEFGARESATLGGVVSTNAGGMNVLRYGMTREQVLGLEVVMADGGLWDGLRVLRKDNSGPDLKHLFIGTEGTLGIVTAVAMRLVPLESESASVFLEAAGMDEVIALSSLAQSMGGECLSSFELISGFAFSAASREVLGQEPPLGGQGRWYVLARFAAGRPVSELAQAFAEAAFEKGLALDGTLPRSLAEEAGLWRIRDSMSELHRHLGPSLRFDLAVPIDALSDLVARLEALVGEEAPEADVLCFGHMGDGNLHFSICAHDDGLPRAKSGADLAQLVHETVWHLGGTISAEHGIGRLHVDELRHQKSPLEQNLGRRLKAAFDPSGMLNPGVIFPSGPED